MLPVTDESEEILSTNEKLNLETARIPWAELQRLYARGVVMVVSENLDLVSVAVAVVDDLADQVKAWVGQGKLRRATDKDALEWYEGEASLWAVAVAPWVLVQQEKSRD
ncbi:DUF2288 domain-containing protein [Sansalvadorimonas sp. 2012CJ34-2]|uniref:DUF2288 domain-containing protein n=1 Tax=Parendozoicomonas callyspongiae TaxID=2942213 RepID=A0ABT0PIK3_9GAMM|nr:DUF2288 family protein [Sansalvadorimonas sp. 2012CJ34-2]MCL6271212.1 DUF2288 domain-containing protein [Sansalvadorimonas sp. 2012CJ34-2]